MAGDNDSTPWLALGIAGVTVVIVVGLVLGVVYTEYIQPNSEETSSVKESKQVKIKREVYSEQESSYTGLPKLSNLTHKEYDSYWESLTKHKYGYESEYDGEIDTELSFKTPKDWIVENTIDKSFLQVNKICFRFYGEKEIWGAIMAIDLSNVSVKNTKEFSNYYNRKKIFTKLFEDVNGSDVTEKKHIFRGFGFGVTEVEQVFAYESYSTVETPEGEYANLTYYRRYSGYGDLGTVIEIYIPVKELTLKTRAMALMVGKSYSEFLLYGENLEKLKPIEENESKS